MSTELKEVRNAKNLIIGWLREYPDRIVATHYKKGYVGSFSKGVGTTVDKNGKIFCYGDGTTTLIHNADMEN